MSDETSIDFDTAPLRKSVTDALLVLDDFDRRLSTLGKGSNKSSLDALRASFKALGDSVHPLMQAVSANALRGTTELETMLTKMQRMQATLARTNLLEATRTKWTTNLREMQAEFLQSIRKLQESGNTVHMKLGDIFEQQEAARSKKTLTERRKLEAEAEERLDAARQKLAKASRYPSGEFSPYKASDAFASERAMKQAMLNAEGLFSLLSSAKVHKSPVYKATEKLAEEMRQAQAANMDYAMKMAAGPYSMLSTGNVRKSQVYKASMDATEADPKLLTSAQLFRANAGVQKLRDSLAQPLDAAPLKAAATHVRTLGEHAEKTTPKMGTLNKALWDSHSAVRGLASGFGLLYLTWGSTLPLLSGAAISFGIANTLKDAKELTKVLSDIQYVAGTSAEDMRKFNTVLLDSKNGAAAPLEVANAMKQLSLAGLKASEAMSVLPVVLNMAKVSGVEVGKTAESLTAVATAFGFSAKGYEHVADVIGVTAASTMADMGDMTEAFRASSVVAQQYGVSLEDVATSLGLLSQVGVKGSAAGTAVRQMYTELMGSSEKAKKALKNVFDLKVIDDATGKMKPLDQIMGAIAGKLADMPRSVQLAQLDKLGNERGLKALSAYLSEIVNKAGDSSEALRNLRDAVENAAGYTALASVGKSLSFGSQWESAAADLKRAMAGAFQSVEDYAVRFMMAVREVFANPEVRSALEGLLSAVLRFGTFLLESADSIVTVGKMVATAAITWVGFNVTLAASALAASVAEIAYRRMTMGLAGVGPISAGAALGLRAVNLAMGAVGVVLTVAATAWMFFADKSEDATTRASKASRDHFKMTVEGLDTNIARLEAEIESIKDVAEASTRGAWVQAKLLEDSIILKHKAYEATLQQVVAEAELTEELAARGKMFSGGGEAGILADSYAGAAATKAATARANLEAARISNAAELAEARTKSTRIIELTKERERLSKLEANKKTRPSGSFVPPEESTQKLKDHTAEVAAIGKAQLDQIRTDMKARLEFLKDYHDAGLMSQGNYEAQSLQVLVESEQALANKLKENLGKELAAEEDHRKEVKKKYADNAKDRLAAEESINNKVTAINEQYAAESLKLTADIQNRERDLWVKQEKALIDIRKKGAEDLAAIHDRIAGLQEESSIAKSTAGLKGPELAAAEARIKVEIAGKKTLRKYDDEIAKARMASQDLLNAAMETGSYTAAQAMVTASEQHDARVQVLLAQRKDLEIGYSEEAATASSLAYSKAFKQEADAVANTLASSITDALFTGGKAGWKKLRDVLKQELLMKPFQMVIQAIIQPVTQAMASGVQGFTSGLTGGGSGGGGLQGLGSMAGSSLSSWFGNTAIGSSLASSFAGSGTALLSGLQGSLGMTATAAQAATAANMGAASSVAGAQSSILSGAQAIGQAIPYVAAALVALNALGVFRKTKQVGSGISGTIGADADINSYSEMRKSGTLFRGPSYWKEYQDMEDASIAVGKAAKSMITNVTGMATALGLNSDKVAGYVMTIDEAAMKFDQRGMTEAQIQAKYTELLTAQMQKYNEELANQVVGLTAVRQVGETSSAALTRMYSEYSAEEMAKVAVLRAQGKDAAALARQRALETALMDETTKAAKMRIYALEDEATAAAAASNSVKSLTDAISEVFAQTKQESLQSRLAAYDKNYALAQSTTGETRAKYADLLAKDLPQLAQDMAAVSATKQDWLAATSALAAKAAKIALLLDPSAKIPAFASGGYHSGGLRLVGERGPELEYTGPSQILNNSLTSAILGGSGQVDTVALESLIVRLTEQVELMRYETRATATHTAKLAKLQTDTYERGQLIRTDADQPIATTVA